VLQEADRLAPCPEPQQGATASCVTEVGQQAASHIALLLLQGWTLSSPASHVHGWCVVQPTPHGHCPGSLWQVLCRQEAVWLNRTAAGMAVWVRLQAEPWQCTLKALWLRMAAAPPEASTPVSLGRLAVSDPHML